jgi:hypothetical protein
MAIRPPTPLSAGVGSALHYRQEKRYPDVETVHLMEIGVSPAAPAQAATFIEYLSRFLRSQVLHSENSSRAGRKNPCTRNTGSEHGKHLSRRPKNFMNMQTGCSNGENIFRAGILDGRACVFAENSPFDE